MTTRATLGRRLILPGVLAAFGTAILIALGVWQLQRLAWKEALIARVEARIGAEPLAAPGPDRWDSLSTDDFDFQPLSARGRYLNDKEIHVFADVERPHGQFRGLGYFVLTPLATDDGWFVIVNRGFVPTERKDQETRRSGLVSGEATAIGPFRPVDRGNSFTPADDPKRNIWFRRDPAAIAVALGLPAERVAPYTIDLRADPTLPGGLPQAGETVVSFPNNHLQYAVTWFGLALALVVTFLAFARSRLRQAGAPPRRSGGKSGSLLGSR